MRELSLNLQKLEPEQVATELNRRCKYCQALMIPKQSPHPLRAGRFTWVFPDTCGCEAESIALAQEQAQAVVTEAQQKEEAIKAILKRAGLIGDLAKATFDTYLPRNDWDGVEDVKGRAIEYTKQALVGVMEQPVLLMHGQWGTGKSHLAAAVIREGLGAGKKCFFRNWLDYLQRLKNSWDNQGDPDKEREEDIINELRTGAIIVIDDLDKGNASDWMRRVLYPVLNSRTNEGKPTIITLNYGPDDIDPKAPGRSMLETYFGVANLDRILGKKCFDSILFDGPSDRTGIKWAK